VDIATITLILLALVITGTLNVVCFLIGVSIRQKVDRDETVEMPKIPSPVKIVNSMRADRIAKAEQQKYETIFQNLEAYDGTSFGQKDLPR
jgi:hypothetical protein